jgi:Skp family chaperone for outer membrane proteins
MPNPKMIPDPDDAEKQILNPDYDPSKNEDGSPIANPDDVTPPANETPEQIELRLKAEFKARMDALDQKRKDAETKVAEFERKEREAETQRLRDEGKLEEAHKRDKEDLEARLRDLENVNTTLTRDNMVDKALRAVEFRNERAADMASQEIVSQLIRNEAGDWVHKSGKSIADYISEFVTNESNAFLLKSKQSSGTGGGGAKPSDGDKSNKSIFDMSQEEVMKMAAAGKLPHQR